MANRTRSLTLDDDAILRRRKLADALTKQSLDPIQGASSGGIAAPISWTQGAEKLANALVAGYQSNKADTEADELKTNRRKEAEDFLKEWKGGNKDALTGALMSDNPLIGQAAPALYGEQSRKDAAAAALEAERANAQTAFDRQKDLRMSPQWQAPQPGVTEPLSPEVEAQKLRLAQAGIKASEMPATLQEWAAFQKMTPEQQTQYLTMKRANNPINLGGSYQFANPANPAGAPIASVPTTLKPGEEPAVHGAQAEAEVIGKAAGEAKVALPAVLATGKQMLVTLEKMRAHPGLSGSVGMKNAAGMTGMPGTKEADFQELLGQISGGVFLQAYQDLKGGGAITQIEGEKAERAKARMGTAQTEGAFREALDEYMQVIRDGLVRAEQKANMGSGTAAPPAGLTPAAPPPPALPPLPPGFQMVP